jgi:PAS domain S-box-containing protein
MNSIAVSITQLMLQLQDPILHIDAKGQLINNNAAAVELIDGIQDEKELKKSIFEIIPTISFLKWKEIFDQVASQGFYQSSGKILHHDGNLSDAKIFISNVDNHSCLLIIQRSKQQNLPLHSSRSDAEINLLDLVLFTLNHSDSLILWVKEDATIHYYNQTVLKVLGYSKAEFKKLKITQINPDLKLKDFKNYWNLIKEKGALNVEHPYYKKNGAKFEVEANLFYVSFHSDEYCCIFMKDISERKQKDAAFQNALKKIKQLKKRLEEEKSYLKAEVAENYSFNNIISQSKNYKPILQKVAQVAETNSTVLITGETGTGKELLARAIHGLSPREDANLVKVNCASLPSQLIESELFGHVKGAFTGAIANKQGKFEIAHNGTLFLDEIGELPLELQAKFLRALQEGEIERVGDPYPINVDVRIIAATNRNLEKMVANNQFREDLYYRLNVFPIHNLPLRDRREDIPLLAQHFLKKYNRRNGKQVTQITQAAIKALEKYDFPGNIRELENLIERAVIISTGETLQLQSVIPNNKQKIIKKGFLTMEELQKQHIIDALQKARGKITGKGGAADLLGMKGKTLASRMYKLGIDRFDFLG